VKSTRLPTLSAKEGIVLELLVSSGAKYGLQLVEELLSKLHPFRLRDCRRLFVLL
jgi:hypothetical protein